MASNRIIRFRGWHPKLKKMFYNLDITHDGKAFCGESIFYCDEIQVDEYTGVHDKNGRAIYENDYLEAEGRRYIVKFMNGCFMAHSILLTSISTHGKYETRFLTERKWEVTGNSHEDK